MRAPSDSARHACLVLAHRSPRQINALTRLLTGGDAPMDVFLHLDARAASLQENIVPRPGLDVCSLHPVRWGTYSIVSATLDLMRRALAREQYARLHLLSGQCLPLWPTSVIAARFARSPNEHMDCAPFPVPGLPYRGFDRILVEYPPELRGRFRGAKAREQDDLKEAVLRDPARHRRLYHLSRLHHGSQWFSVSGAFAAYVLEYVDAHPELGEFFESSLIPDEMFFQTILMASPFAASFTRDTGRYIDWVQGGPHTLRAADLPAILNADMIFARKFDADTDETVVARIARVVELRAVRPGLSVPALLEAANAVNTLADAGLEETP